MRSIVQRWQFEMRGQFRPFRRQFAGIKNPDFLGITNQQLVDAILRDVDRDNNKVISRTEFRSFFARLTANMSDEHMNHLWSQLGANPNTDSVDQQTFTKHVSKFLDGSGILYRALDKAGRSSEGGKSDGVMSAEDYLRYIKKRVALLERIKKQKYLFKHRGDFMAHHKFLEEQEVTIIGAPIDAGQAIPGTDLTPGIYRNDPKYYNKLRANGWTVKDVDLDFEFTYGLLPDPTHIRAKNAHSVGLSTQLIYEHFVREADAGNFVLTLGGDHSVSLGTFAGATSMEGCCVFIVDAHGDTTVPEISQSGNFHKMSVGCHFGLSQALLRLPGWSWFNSGLSPDNVVFIGLRDLEPIERDVLYGLGCHFFPPVDILGMGGIRNVMDVAMERVNPKRNKRIHLSFDIDACDPVIAPSTGTLTEGGLSYVESLFIPQYLWETGCLTSMDLTEVNTHVLRGAPAGRPDLVITKDNIPTDLHEIQEIELRQNPNITLTLGWEIVMRGLGMNSLNLGSSLS